MPSLALCAEPRPVVLRYFAPPVAPAVEEPDARVRNVPEAVLHDVWAGVRFDAKDLTTTAGDVLTILNPGRHNHDTGPDFTGARLQSADGLVWAGDVEIHRTSGEWLLHRHHEDKRYDRVVLHVVLAADRHTGTLRRADGTLLPEVVLLPRLGSSLRRLLFEFYAHPRPDFYCAPLWPSVPDETKRPWIRALGLQRLHAKAAALGEAYGTRPDLDTLLFEATFRALGHAKNADPMSELARRVPLALLRTLDRQEEVEAALFGTSGLLPSPDALAPQDDRAAVYVADLAARFERLRAARGLVPMPTSAWQFFRLRPASFPTRRIAQAAALLRPSAPGQPLGILQHDPLGRLREALRTRKPVAALREVLLADTPSGYWAEPGRVARWSGGSTARLGRDRADVLLMDAVLPALLLDAEGRHDPADADRVERVLTTLASSSNEVTRRYELQGTTPANALEAQGLHQLHQAYCLPARCLACAVGLHILRRQQDV